MNNINDKRIKIREFTDLNVWKEGHKLVIMIYKITDKFPRKEFSLMDQMKRAAVSITSNIAEGFGRQGFREKIQFYYLAQGSLTELKNQTLIAKDVNLITNNDVVSLNNQLSLVHKLLQGLITKSKTFINLKS